MIEKGSQENDCFATRYLPRNEQRVGRVANQIVAYYGNSTLVYDSTK